ncbi:MAG: transposase [Lentimicrobium sp.]|nr:transposase [Lentimicrobium sp.]
MKQDILEEGAVYHIFNRGNNKENIFRTEDNYFYFLNKATFYLKPYYDVYAYCLMPNHFHFLLRVREINKQSASKPRSLAQPLSNLFNSYTRSYNNYFVRTGSLFQEHYRRERVTTDEYFRNIFIYIHNNPVHHEFVSEAKDYKWSSWNAYLTSDSHLLMMEYPLQVFDGIEAMGFLINSRKDILLDKSF